jgi:mono/diheme cytochrome c family protein
MKKITNIIAVIAVLGSVSIAVTSCGKHDPNSPGVEYMPDMYRSPSFETNSFSLIAHTDGTFDTIETNRLPVAGTIARGFLPYPYSNDTTGYANAGKYLHDPLPVTEANVNEGEALFGKYCVHCHGTTGQGDGKVAGKLPGPPPSYTGPVLMALPEGKMFHTITYGKNLMGSHASQLSKDERWKVIMYIHKLQYPNGMPVAAVADSTASKKEIKGKAKGKKG